MHHHDRIRVLAGHFVAPQQDLRVPSSLETQCTLAHASRLLEGQVRQTVSGYCYKNACKDHCNIKSKLAPQVAIITGSGQGVGAAAAKLFAEHGAKVVVTDIDAGKSEQVGLAQRMQALFFFSSSLHEVSLV